MFYEHQASKRLHVPHKRWKLSSQDSVCGDRHVNWAPVSREDTSDNSHSSTPDTEAAIVPLSPPSGLGVKI